MYQIDTKNTKWIQNISNGRKIDQMTIKYTHKIDPLKFTHIGLWFENMPSGNPDVGVCELV
jgi:hypothetical protein